MLDNIPKSPPVQFSGLETFIAFCLNNGPDRGEALIAAAIAANQQGAQPAAVGHALQVFNTFAADAEAACADVAWDRCLQSDLSILDADPTTAQGLAQILSAMLAKRT